MSNLKRTIVLKGDLYRWHGEGIVDTTRCKPGYLVEMKSNGKFQPHSTRGGRSTRYFAKEDDLRGGTIDGTLQYGDTYYNDTDLMLFHKAQPGDTINCVLQVLESVTIGDYAISYGNGKVCKAASAVLANATAASTALTNTVTETAFSNASVIIPANTLKVGDVLRFRVQGIATVTNSTDTLLVKLYETANVLATTGAVDVANNDIFVIDVTLVVRTIGATGTYVGFGTVSLGASTTVTAKAINIASTTIDTTAAITIAAKGTWSVASASDSCRCDVFLAEHVSGSSGIAAASGAGDVIGQFQETLDLSAASADDFVAVEIMG